MSTTRRIGYLVALVGPIALSVLLLPLRSTEVGPALALVLVIPLVGGAALGGRGPGVVGAVVTAACYDFFFTRPFNSLSINATEDILTTVALLVVGWIVSELLVQRQRSDAAAAARERDVRSLRRVAGVGAGGDDPGWLILAACSELAEMLDVEVVDYVPGPPPVGLALLGHGKVVVPSGSPDGPHGQWMVAVPVGREGHVPAHFLVEFPSSGALLAVPPDARAQVVAVADLLGGALSRVPRPSVN